MSHSKAFTVYIYEQEKRYLEWLVLQRQNIETGGDLFGLWQDQDTVIVQLILGPGKCCTRTETSFYQDTKYLSSVGDELTTSKGLCNIGEWHSHHRIDLPSPSQGDQTTVWNHMDSIAGGRFLVFIASITGSKKQPHVIIGCFMFSSDTGKMSEGSLMTLQGSSPIRGQFNDVSFEPGPEKGVSWGTFVEAVKANQNMKTKRMRNKPAVTLGNRHNRETTGTVKGWNESQPGKERRGREKTGDVTDKTRLISSTPNATYGSAKSVRSKSSRKKTKKNSEGHEVIHEVITTPPEDPYNRPMRDFTTPTPPSDNNGRNKWTSIFCCCKYEDVTSPTPPSDNNDRNKWTSIFCCKYDKLNDEEKTTMLRK